MDWAWWNNLKNILMQVRWMDSINQPTPYIYPTF